ncbi:hypothetical protein TURU_101851 [Turdus rufiventris]|nr:hypothetical protein TURU_101851 [Turdus rufiventris]
MGNLMDDPIGVADHLDEFLGTSIYTYDDINAILRSLFSIEEQEMIRQAAIQDWECRNPLGGRGDQRWPNMRPSWDAQMEEGRLRTIELRGMVIQGVQEVGPKGQNLSKALGECQKREESPDEWLGRLKKSIRIYSGMDPDSPIGEILLKTQFVAKSWEDIRRKLEKMEVWQEKGLQEFLKEAQRVYMKREIEQQKTNTKVFMAAVRETQRREQTQGNPRLTPNQQTQKKRSPPQKKQADGQGEEPECFYCKKRGHFKRDCKKRIKDEKMFQED